jgi:hypothetical protein
VGLSATTLNFGNNSIGPLGLAGVLRTVTLTSNGTAPLRIGTASIVGTNADNYSIASDTCSNQTLNPGTTVTSQCSISVRFRALAPTGTKTATLSIPSNVLTSPTNVALTGNATP